MFVPRIIIDTNVLVKALRSRDGSSFQLLSRVESGLFELALTVPLLFEYEDVLHREHLGINKTRANAVLDYLCALASKHNVYFMWRPYLKDPKDDMVLEAAVSSESTHIITFNLKDFDGVGNFGVQASTPREFLLEIGVKP